MFVFSRFLRAADDAGTGTPPNPPAPPEPPSPPPPAEPAAPPPAARIVVSGTKTEREMELERQLEEARQLQRRAEMEAAAKTDEFHRYKQTVEVKPPPKPPKIGVGWWPVED